MNGLDQIDRELAEKVMGWKYHENIASNEYGGTHTFWENEKGEVIYGMGPFTPTRSIPQAFQVVERMRELGWMMKLLNNIWSIDKPGALYSCDFFNEEGQRVSVLADTPAEAISQAALKAWNVYQPKPSESAGPSGPDHSTQ